jgi:quercetin dioxygenase-like cupin family protein
MKIRVTDHVKFQADKMAKIALATTAHAQLDLYCVAPGQAQTPHSHADQDKIYYVLQGRGRFRVGADEHTVEAGEAVVAGAGVEHGFVNEGSAPLVALVVVTPLPAHLSRATHGLTGRTAPDQ